MRSPILVKIASTENLTDASREAFARKLIENEENLTDKSLEVTDIITRIGPTLGLMGTLIPLGTGLAALGSGDVNTLSQSLIVAFDTTVVGIGSGAVAYVISKLLIWMYCLMQYWTLCLIISYFLPLLFFTFFIFLILLFIF